MPPRLRRVLFWTHLTAGLCLALPIFVLCITGFLMTYERQMEARVEHLHFKSHPPASDAPALGFEALIAAIHGARGVEPESITVFADAARPLEIQLPGKPPSVLYIDSYSGAILGEPSPNFRQVFRRIRAWHLALGVSGKQHLHFRALVNGANLAAFFLAVFGVFLWMPRRWRWQSLRPVIMLHRNQRGRARDFNWHNAIGIWSAAPLLIIIWTAMAMSYGWARQLTDRVIRAGNAEWLAWHGADAAAVATGFAVPDNEVPGAPLNSLDALMAHAKAQKPGWKAITMLVPRREAKRLYFTIDMNGDGIREIFGLGLDPAGRMVSLVREGGDGVSSTTFVRYGHTGEAWGIAGQTIAGIASFGGAMLVWTGISLSLRRFRLWRSRGRAHAAHNRP